MIVQIQREVVGPSLTSARAPERLARAVSSPGDLLGDPPVQRDRRLVARFSTDVYASRPSRYSLAAGPDAIPTRSGMIPHTGTFSAVHPSTVSFKSLVPNRAAHTTIPKGIPSG